MEAVQANGPVGNGWEFQNGCLIYVGTPQEGDTVQQNTGQRLLASSQANRSVAYSPSHVRAGAESFRRSTRAANFARGHYQSALRDAASEGKLAATQSFEIPESRKRFLTDQGKHPFAMIVAQYVEILKRMSSRGDLTEDDIERLGGRAAKIHPELVHYYKTRATKSRLGMRCRSAQTVNLRPHQSRGQLEQKSS